VVRALNQDLLADLLAGGLEALWRDDIEGNGMVKTVRIVVHFNGDPFQFVVCKDRLQQFERNADNYMFT